MMTEGPLEAVVSIAEPRQVVSVDLHAAAWTLIMRIDFAAGSRFAVAGADQGIDQ